MKRGGRVGSHPRVWSTIGSSNFDDRSFRLNDEVNVNVYDEGIAAQMEKMFVDDLSRSQEITLRQIGTPKIEG